MSSTVIIANPNSGGGRDLEALSRHADANPDFTLLTTRGPNDARLLARSAAGAGAEIVAAAGGDGTIHEVVRGIVGTGRRTALGVIPMGTGNDLARSLGIPIDLEEALAILAAKRRRAMDLMGLEMDDGVSDVCANAASGGFSGRVHDSLDDEVKRFWGPLSYLRSAMEVIGDTEAWEVTLSIDGRVQRLRALNVVIANGRFAGRGIPIAPGADPFDGLLDVAVIGDAPVLQLSRLAPALLHGEDPESEHFFGAQGRQVTLAFERPMPFSVDGERMDWSSARFTILPGRLHVVVP